MLKKIMITLIAIVFLASASAPKDEEADEGWKLYNNKQLKNFE